MRVKPAPWAVDRAGVDPAFQDLWNGLELLLPLWSSGSTTYDAINQLEGTIEDAGTAVSSQSITRAGIAVLLDEGVTAERIIIPNDSRFDYSRDSITCTWLMVPNWNAGDSRSDALGGIGDNSNRIWRMFGQATLDMSWQVTGRTAVEPNNNGWWLAGDLVLVFGRADGAGTYLDVYVLNTGDEFHFSNANTSTFGGIASQDLTLGERFDGGTAFGDFNLLWFAQWADALPISSMERLAADPFGLIRPASLIIPEVLLWPSIDDDPASPIDTDYINNAVAL